MVLLAAVVVKEIYFLEGKFGSSPLLIYCCACLFILSWWTVRDSEVSDVFSLSFCSYAHSAYVYQNYLTGCYPKEVIISTHFSSFCVSQMAYKVKSCDIVA